MASASIDRDPFDQLAEEFTKRVRRGEEPPISEFTRRHPELADEIRRVFPSIILIERLKPANDIKDEASRSSADQRIKSMPERLGDYRLIREIGRGGMGVVYEAEQESLGRRVAVKVLSASARADPSRVRRFEREARATARLHHTNIVPVFGVGEQDGTAYYVMQLIPGLGLDAVLADLKRILRPETAVSGDLFCAANDVDHDPENGRDTTLASGWTAMDVARSMLSGAYLDEKRDVPTALDRNEQPDPTAPSWNLTDKRFRAGTGEFGWSSDSQRSRMTRVSQQFFHGVAHIGIQIAEALDYANKVGVLHRDIKPSNLLLDPRGNVWVTDFGLAKVAETDDLTQTGEVVGTIRYIAPERFRGICDARSDLYSLGLTLYELLSLRPAFEAADRHDLIRKVSHESPPSLKKLVPSLPADLETIIIKTIARERSDRYASAQELADDLRRFVEYRPIRARRASRTDLAWRWCLRNPVVAGLATALLLVLSVGTIVSTSLAINARSEAGRAGLAADRSRQAEAVAREEADRTRHALYDADLRLASELWDSYDGAAGQVSSLLEAHVPDGKEPDLREFAWHYQHSLMTSSALATVPPLPAPTNLNGGRSSPQVAFADDRLIVLDGKGELTTWELEQNRPVRTRALGYDGGLPLAALSPDGRTAACVGPSGNLVRLFDVTSGKFLGELAMTRPLTFLAFSCDGRTIAATSDDLTARIWNVDNRTLIRSILPRSATARDIAVSRDGRLLALADHPTKFRIALYDFDAALPRVIDGSMTIQSIAFAPDGKSLAASDFRGTVKVRNTSKEGSAEQIIDSLVGYVTRLAYSPSGAELAIGGADGQVVVWDLRRHEAVRRAKGHLAPVGALAFSADGRLLATADDMGSIRVWETRRRSDLARFAQHPGAPVNAVCAAYSPDGQWLATGFGRLVWIWNPRAAEAIRWLGATTGIVTRIAFSSDGKLLAVGDSASRVKLFQFPGGRLIRTLYGWPPGTTMTRGTVAALAFSPDGSAVAAGFGGRFTGFNNYGFQIIKVWNLANDDEPRQWEAHANSVTAILFTPDGSRMATASHDGSVKLWEASTGKELQNMRWDKSAAHRRQSSRSAENEATFFSSQFFSAAISRDGKMLATGRADGLIVLWNLASGKPRSVIQGHNGRVSDLAFSPDNRTLASAGTDRLIKVWDAQTDRELRALRGHRNWLTSVAFAPDGASIASLDIDGALAVWGGTAPLARPGLRPPIAPSQQEIGPVIVAEERAELDRALKANPTIDQLLHHAWLAVHDERFSEAATDYRELLRRQPGLSSIFGMHALQLHHCHVLALLASGDHRSLRRECRELLELGSSTSIFWHWNAVAWYCSLVPGDGIDRPRAVALAELAVARAAGSNTHRFLNTLGIALYRAGRHDDAIRRIEQGIEHRSGLGIPDDWAILAMAHARLGHHSQAIGFLERMPPRVSVDDDETASFWERMDTRILRSEAESVVKYDSVFPPDPFRR